MSRRRKIIDREKLVEEYRAGASIAELARNYEVWEQTICNNLDKLGEPRRPAHRPKRTQFQNWCAHLRSRYPGFTWPLFRRMWREQSGRCAICRRKIRVKNKRYRGAVVDHNHRTGQVRTLLCYGCNLSLGNFGDCPAICERAAEYLRRYGYASNDWNF